MDFTKDIIVAPARKTTVANGITEVRQKVVSLSIYRHEGTTWSA